MIRLTEFHLDSPWMLALLVAVPLLLAASFSRRRRLAADAGDAFQDPGRVRKVTLVVLLLTSLLLVCGGALAFRALVTGPSDPLKNPVVGAGLALLALAVLLATLAVWHRRRQWPVMQVSSTAALGKVAAGRPSPLRHLVPLLRLLAICLVLLALARPLVATTEADVFAEGMDIVLTLDVSTSMRAVDFSPIARPNERKNRINGAKEVISKFIRQRKEDRLGLVVFASNAFTQCPLTLDYSVVQNILQAVKTGVIEDGTAIGDAIMISINRLEKSEAKSKVIILLTDGDDNASKVAPLQAAEVAHEKKIRVFPILVGKGGLVPYPVGRDVFGQPAYRKVEIRTNPELLKQIAKKSLGKFYRATDEKALEEDFQDILDHMEKTRLMDPGRFTRSTEVFQLALLPALLLVLLELMLRWTRFRRFP
ncbi:MAG TPA: VWA domain-containing protein [Myxococcota bacterium]|nr:VWA domain-containing protein [Myxococcota bacterium]